MKRKVKKNKNTQEIQARKEESLTQMKKEEKIAR